MSVRESRREGVLCGSVCVCVCVCVVRVQSACRLRCVTVVHLI